MLVFLAIAHATPPVVPSRARHVERCNGRDDDGDPTTTDAGLVTLNDRYTFSSLKLALALAADGDTVAVCSGTWTGAFVIDDAITLTAPEALGSVFLQGTGNDPVLRIRDNALVSEVYITGAVGDEIFGGASGVLVEPGWELRLENSVVQQNEGYGVWVDVQASLFTHGTSIVDNQDSGIRIEEGGLAELSDTAVFYNHAAAGGGVSVGPYAALVGGRLSYNDAPIGGGLWVEDHGVAIGTWLTDNVAGNGGGVAASPLATLDGLEVTANSADYGGGVAVMCGEGALGLTGSWVSANRAVMGGGGVSVSACDGPSAGIDLTGTSVMENTSADLGGGLWVGPGAVVTGGTVTGNEAAFAGGGMAVLGGAILENVDLGQNVGGLNGGGIAGYQLTEGLVLFGVSVHDNTAGNGGGIDAHTPEGGGMASVILDSGSSIVGNSASGLGGGILIGGDVVGDATLIAGNTADRGGGIFLFPSDFVPVSVEGVEIFDNTAASSGGGVYVSWFGGLWPISVVDSKLSGNTATEGGGLSSDGHSGGIVLDGTEVSGNTASEGGGVWSRWAVLSLVSGSITGNRALESGGGIFAGGTHVDAVTGSFAITGNTADLRGGAVALTQASSLDALQLDLGAGPTDNAPEDLFVEDANLGYSYPGPTTVSCDMTGCVP